MKQKNFSQYGMDLDPRPALYLNNGYIRGQLSDRNHKNTSGIFKKRPSQIDPNNSSK